jgi:CHAT domain-containing protein
LRKERLKWQSALGVESTSRQPKPLKTSGSFSERSRTTPKPNRSSKKRSNGPSDPAQESIGRGEKGDIEDWSFASLEGTQKESDELTKAFTGWGWTASDFTAKEATKEALLKIHSPYILHLATHGFFR